MRLLLACLCAFSLLCVLVLAEMAWPIIGYWTRYYEAEIVVAMVVGMAVGQMLYDWATKLGGTST